MKTPVKVGIVVAMAQKNLAVLLIHGKGVDPDISLGLQLLRETSSKGLPAADGELGNL